MNQVTIQPTDKKVTYTMAEMISKVSAEPKPQMVYSGIKEGTVGFVFGPSKSGKSTYCEALGMSLACGAEEFLGIPILTKGVKVLSISLEEHYTNRTERNIKQVEVLTEKYGTDWLKSRYFTIGDELSRYIVTNEHWEELKQAILSVQPKVVIIDSLTRLAAGKIEDSDTANGLMKRLRNLADSTNTTIICIHHTHKMYDKPISLDTLAGSRVIGQEADFMIGINRTLKGTRYIKEVAFRYAPSNDDTVQTFAINENNLIVPQERLNEFRLIAQVDGRNNEQTDQDFLNLFKEKGTVSAEDLVQKFVDTDIITKPALYKRINKAIKQGIIDRPETGKYILLKNED